MSPYIYHPVCRQDRWQVLQQRHTTPAWKHAVNALLQEHVIDVLSGVGSRTARTIHNAFHNPLLALFPANRSTCFEMVVDAADQIVRSRCVTRSHRVQ